MQMNTARDAMRRGLSPCSPPHFLQQRTRNVNSVNRAIFRRWLVKGMNRLMAMPPYAWLSPPALLMVYFSKSRNTTLSCLSSQR